MFNNIKNKSVSLLVVRQGAKSRTYLLHSIIKLSCKICDICQPLIPQPHLGGGGRAGVARGGLCSRISQSWASASAGQLAARHPPLVANRGTCPFPLAEQVRLVGRPFLKILMNKFASIVLFYSVGQGYSIPTTTPTGGQVGAGHTQPVQPAASLAMATGWLDQARPVCPGYHFPLPF